VSQPDFQTIVIGSGISGLFVAIEARAAGPVLVITKGSIEDCNTRWAQGGIAAAVGPGDSPEQHFTDTVNAGAGLVDEVAARLLCDEAPARIADLIRHGVAFDALDGAVALGREAAHGRDRVLHAGGDRTGAAIETALAHTARGAEITIFDHTMATSLVVRDGRVTGVRAMDLQSGRTTTYGAHSVVIASGGAGRLFAYTTNPDVATGDGIALAFEAGAEIADIEFYQFHPTALQLPDAPVFLITEAIRGEGAVLANAAGERFMPRYHVAAELAPRDVVARAIVAEMRATGAPHVFLDCSSIKGVDLAARFPGVFAHCLRAGIDIRTRPIPVAPAAHYLMGGIRTDTWGRTTLEGLYACGECACTGVHGANRLASNSLMETVVFGKRVSEHIVAGGGGRALPADDVTAERLPTGDAPSHAAIQRVMWDGAGIERTAAGLAAGLDEVTSWRTSAPAGVTAGSRREGLEAHALTAVGLLMLRTALRREESRGGHYRSDFPVRDDRRWRRHQVVRRVD
jgi:L-aspartate oxidase